MSLYRIGVDVGGTNTDAAIIDIKALNGPERGVLASHKAPTTPDITSGIEGAIGAVLAESRVDQSHVLSVTIGTTHFINALVEADARRLDRVCVVRLSGAFSRQIPPFSDFPVGLRRILDGGVHYLDGGLEMDGREIASLDEAQIRQAARDIFASGVRSVALVGIFSPLDHENIHEERCRFIMQDEVPELQIVCSHSIGPTGFLERENATILNAAILRTARRVSTGFEQAMLRLNLRCPLFLSQNDGTLIEASTAAEFPIKTFASGPTNSMIGAAFLAGLDRTSYVEEGEGGSDTQEPQIIVVDIGGTTTDVCALLPSGFPRQAPGFVEIAAVRTAFSMPEVISAGLGGGSKVTVEGESGNEIVDVGPASVGHYIREQSRVFGGSQLTATDIVVALGRADLGDATRLQDVPATIIDQARLAIKRKLEALVEQMRVSAAPVHVLLVGGGAILVTEPLEGVEKCIQPVHHGAANAVGAAIAKVSGEIDTVALMNGQNEKAVVAAACDKAIKLAVDRGADPKDVRIVEVNKMRLQYMSTETIRIQVRATGKLAIPEEPTPPPSPPTERSCEQTQETEEGPKVSVSDALQPTIRPLLEIDLQLYRPDVRDGVWYVSEVDLELMATGCGVLGTGGGGPTHHEFLVALEALRTGGRGKMRVVSPKALADDASICFGSWYGSPTVINERIAGGEEISMSIKAVGKILGIEKFDGVLLDEVGGGNGMSGFPTSVQFDIPVVDGDGMGRAFPTMYHVTFSVYGHSLVPCVLTDARGNTVTVTHADTPQRLERILRTAAIELGLGCAVSSRPMSGAVVKKYCVPNTLSQAWYLGRAVHLARRTKLNYVDAIFDVCPGKLLFTGKIIDVRRQLGGGYAMGDVLIAPLGDNELEVSSSRSRQAVATDKHLIVPFQNEYLYAALCPSDGAKDAQQVLCTVPDLISILGQDGEAIGSQDLRYGLRVNVIAMPAHPLWKSPEGLQVGGPEGFGLTMPVVAIDSDFKEARSVIDDFQ